MNEAFQFVNGVFGFANGKKKNLFVGSFTQKRCLLLEVASKASLFLLKTILPQLTIAFLIGIVFFLIYFVGEFVLVLAFILIISFSSMSFFSSCSSSERTSFSCPELNNQPVVLLLFLSFSLSSFLIITGSFFTD